MKTNHIQAGTARNARGMTLVEMMTTTGLFTLMIAGLLAVNMFGLKQDELANSQLGASDQARMNFNLLLAEIRSGKNVQIGTGWSTNFTPVGNGPQQGDTIQIQPSTNTNVLIYYYFYTNAPSGVLPSNSLIRVSIGTNSSGTWVTNTNTVAKCIANVTNQWMTNSLNFSALALSGTNWVLLTNDPTTASTHNYIVTTLLQFYQYQYPLTYVGTNCLYDYYQINLQAARRAP